MEKEIIKIIANNLHIKESAIKLDTKLFNLEIDSIDLVAIFYDFIKKYTIDVKYDFYESFNKFEGKKQIWNVADLIKFLENSMENTYNYNELYKIIAKNPKTKQKKISLKTKLARDLDFDDMDRLDTILDVKKVFGLKKIRQFEKQVCDYDASIFEILTFVNQKKKIEKELKNKQNLFQIIKNKIQNKVM